jgi:hypothetical protein
MKKLYILIVVLFMNLLPIYSQISLTLATHGIVAGDVYSYYIGDTTGFNPGAGGANVTWTYSGWNIGKILETINYVSVASTPYAASFPTATYAVESDGSYNYYSTGTGGFLNVGYADSADVIKYTDNEKYYPYPVTYLTPNNDIFSGADTVAGIKSKVSGVITSSGDGWGKLIINGRTYNNVLRIKTIEETNIFKINISTGDTGVALRQILTSYQWYRQNSKNPIIFYEEKSLYVAGFPTPIMTDKNIFVDYLVTAINNHSAESMNFAIYPNPTKGFVNLKSEFSSPQKLNIEIINTNGQLVYTDFINAESGMVNHTIDVSALPQGIYSVRVFNNETFGIRKLIIQ